MGLLKIGDFSQLGQVTVRTLRHYDELGLLSPEHIDRFTGYRYYKLEQLPRLNRILALKDLGFSLEQIADLLEGEFSADQLRKLLKTRQRELEKELRDGMLRLARVNARLSQIEQEGAPPDDFEVVIKQTPPIKLLGLRSLIPSVDVVGDYCDTHLLQLRTWLRESGFPAGGRTINFYHMNEYREADIDMESAVVLEDDLPEGVVPPAGMEIREEPAVTSMASLTRSMSFIQLPQNVMILLRWVASNGMQFDKPLREIHLFGDPLAVDSREEHVIELQVPVMRLSA